MFWCNQCGTYVDTSHNHMQQDKAVVGTAYTVTYDRDYTQVLKEIANALDRIADAISRR